MYRVLTEVGLRPVASMNSSHIRNVPVGTTFSGNTTTVNEYGQNVTFVAYKEGYLPVEFDGVKYLKEYEPEDIPKTITLKSLQVEFDEYPGELYVSTGSVSFEIKS